jgi:hypothetical protein
MILHLPASSPELNHVERVRGCPRGHNLRNRACKEYDGFREEVRWRDGETVNRALANGGDQCGCDERRT